ncbi:hypothetical protein SAICODRAFT_18902 [Saitoella complicata NRRL Y-17804]|uniref:Zn(2)-C6 fungal-type domain-containing protein n=1 Tax=Saitoella complicata (strain BCRC 22490 / CBS 7301 / JCM 7358 / NBRC 10748 / NRRL Y-17804) TaxID=698492 RepID=A0A0E9NH07_SAICN|nr:uncharacterized protein SAICODRAFT_18902 [Saitoella complicata NRRL Y-17804]ODQ53412.1 hypothetical protein SAICODRAFT_18902 [Saitoella complicata NRRL Y-17804]GAO48951.1 hypothetical protein G7K_3112-t1 [Saitoella complicata NRRL Y-17804]
MDQQQQETQQEQQITMGQRSSPVQSTQTQPEQQQQQQQQQQPQQQQQDTVMGNTEPSPVGSDVPHPTEGTSPNSTSPTKVPTKPHGNSEKPGVNRVRLTQACNTCRDRKIKCSGDEPCRHCLKVGTECVYEKVRGKRGPKKGSLVGRVRNKDKTSPGATAVPGSGSDTGQNHKQNRNSTSAPRSDSASMRSASDQETSPVSAQSTLAHAHEVPPVRGHNRSHSISASAQQQAPPPMQTPNSQKPKVSGKVNLPVMDIPKAAVLHLIGLFFTHVNNHQYELLHKEWFLEELRKERVSAGLLYAMCAVAAKYSRHPSLKADPLYIAGERFATLARTFLRQHVDGGAMQPRLSTVQTLTILAVYEYDNARGAKAWMDIGNAIRIAQILGYDRLHEPVAGAGSSKSFTFREVRRRTLWTLYIMERLHITGSPSLLPVLGVAGEDLTIQLPVKSELALSESPKETETLCGAAIVGEEATLVPNMGAFAYLVKISTIWGKAVKYVQKQGRGLRERESSPELDSPDHLPMWHPRSSFTTLTLELQAWSANLPEHLAFSPNTLAAHIGTGEAGLFVLMHVMYHQTICYLHRTMMPSASPSVKLAGVPKQFLRASRQKATLHANAVSSVMNSVMQRKGLIVLSSFAGYSMFNASTILIHNATSSIQETANLAKANFQTNLRVMTVMKDYFKPVGSLCDSISWMYEVQTSMFGSHHVGQKRKSIDENEQHSSDDPDSPVTGHALTAEAAAAASANAQPNKFFERYFRKQEPMYAPLSIDDEREDDDIQIHGHDSNNFPSARPSISALPPHMSSFPPSRSEFDVLNPYLQDMMHVNRELEELGRSPSVINHSGMATPQFDPMGFQSPTGMGPLSGTFPHQPADPSYFSAQPQASFHGDNQFAPSFATTPQVPQFQGNQPALTPMPDVNFGMQHQQPTPFDVTGGFTTAPVSPTTAAAQAGHLYGSLDDSMRTGMMGLAGSEEPVRSFQQEYEDHSYLGTMAPTDFASLSYVYAKH